MNNYHSTIALLALFACFISSLSAQPTTFISKFGVGSQGVSHDLIVMSNGDIIVSGRIDFSQTGFLARMDNTGQMLWGGKLPHGIQLRKLYLGSGDHFFACGSQDSLLTSSHRGIVAYFDGNGQNLWLRQLDGNAFHHWQEGAVLKSGNILVCADGFVNQNSVDHLSLLDVSGNFLWERQFADAGGMCVAAYGGDGALVGRNNFHSNYYTTTLSQLDGNGNFLRTDTFDLGLHDIATFHDSLIYLSGIASGGEVLVELDSLFNIHKALDFSYVVAPKRLRFNPDGNLCVSGEWNVFGAYYGGFGIFRPSTGIFGADGWTMFKGYGTTEMHSTPDGGYAVGFSYGINNPIELRVEKLNLQLRNACDSMPNTLGNLPNYPIQHGPTSVSASPISNSFVIPTISLVPDGLGFLTDCLTSVEETNDQIIKIWPNPVHSKCNLEWNPSEFGLYEVTLRVWSSLGKLEIAVDLKNDGYESVDLSHLSSGFYHVQISNVDGITGRLGLAKH